MSIDRLNPVLLPWVMQMNWKQQSILLSSLRGPDVPKVPNIKNVNRWMRGACQHNADPSKNYMSKAALPVPIELCNELEFLPCHYVHHFADGLAVIAYNHPDRTVSLQAGEYHYRIAEELFHFRPEPPYWFPLRHADKIFDGSEPRKEPTPFDRTNHEHFSSYMDLINLRFAEPPQ